MREILFRGRVVKTGEWVYGDLVHHPYNTILINGVSVVRETVGQYTGLNDSFREKIFEGDIVKFQGNRYIVKYTKILCAFQMYKADDNLRLKALHLIDSVVIGTIYDTMEFICRNSE
jgi:hypothetical protein